MWPFYATLAFVATYIIYYRFFHPLARVPGPFVASITPVWLVWQCWHLRRPRMDLELHKKYGSVVRIAPDKVIFSNPAYFKAVYGAGTKFTKSRYYEGPTKKTEFHTRDWDQLDMLAEWDTQKLGVQKRLGMPVYNRGQGHQGLMDNNLRRWFKRLRGITARPVDMWSELELLIVDTMCEVTFAQPFGAVESGSDGGQMHNMWVQWTHWAWIANLPSLNMLERRITNLGAKLMLVGRKNLPLFPFCGGKVAECMKTTSEGKVYPPCLLDDFMKLSQSNPDFKPSWGIALAMTNLGAGVDTMSQTLAAVIDGIARDKSVHDRLQTEMNDAVDDGSVSKGEPVSYEAAAKMEYLQACIHEALRFRPNVAVALPRIVSEGGVEMDGYYIPAGYEVGMNPRQLGRSEKVFGQDTDKFKPERWLQASPEQRNDMEMYNLGFGGPNRKCPGQRLAYVVMLKVLASLFLHFDVKVLNEMGGPPGPGGGRMVEKGAFPHKWNGWEVEINVR